MAMPLIFRARVCKKDTADLSRAVTRRWKGDGSLIDRHAYGSAEASGISSFALLPQASNGKGYAINLIDYGCP